MSASLLPQDSVGADRAVRGRPSVRISGRSTTASNAETVVSSHAVAVVRRARIHPDLFGISLRALACS